MFQLSGVHHGASGAQELLGVDEEATQEDQCRIWVYEGLRFRDWVWGCKLAVQSQCVQGVGIARGRF